MSGNTNLELQTSEKRGSNRVSVQIDVTPFIESSEKSFECKILDISETGARLELNDIDIIPSRLKLYLPEDDCIYDCKVVWRKKQQCGLIFINSVTL